MESAWERRTLLWGVGEGDKGLFGRFGEGRLGEARLLLHLKLSGGDSAAWDWELAAEKRAEGHAAVVLLQEWLWLYWLGLPNQATSSA